MKEKEIQQPETEEQKEIDDQFWKDAKYEDEKQFSER